MRSKEKIIIAGLGVLVVLLSCKNPLMDRVTNAVEVAKGPKIALTIDANAIASGDTRDFGQVVVGNTATISITVTNAGKSDLALNGGAAAVSLGGTDHDQFALSTPPSASSIPVGQSATFSLSFSPTSGGTKTASVTVASNDPSTESYPFTITGTGIWKGTVATPTFSPPPGTYSADSDIVISCPTEGAVIHYTTSQSGTPPDPTASSTVFDPASPIHVAGDGATIVVKAIATIPGYVDSAVASSSYTVSYSTVSTPSFDSVQPGAYTSAQTVTLFCSTPGATIHYSLDGEPDPSATVGHLYPDEPIVIPLSTTKTVRAVASKPGMQNSTMLSGTFIVTGAVAKPIFSTTQPGVYQTVQTVTLTTTTAGATIIYRTDGQDPIVNGGFTYNPSTPPTVPLGTIYNICAFAKKDGMANSDVLVGTFTVTGQVATPTFATVQPGTYTTAQNVTLACTTSGAEIHYTTDGSTPPTLATTKYTGAITVPLNTTMVIRAKAFLTTWTDSTELSGTYTVTGTVATPTISPVPTAPSNTFTVTLGCTTSSASIRYTTDGTTPTSGYGNVYSAPFALARTTTVQAIAYKTDWTTSGLASQAYVVAWAGSYGDTSADAAYGVAQASDGSYYIAATSTTNLRRLEKLNLDGTISWTRTYTQNALALGNPIAIVSDGMVTIGGSHSEGTGIIRTRVSKIGSTGAITWSKKFYPASYSEGVGSFNFYAIEELPSGNYTIAGTEYDDMRGSTLPVLVEIGSTGGAVSGSFYNSSVDIPTIGGLAVLKDATSVYGYAIAANSAADAFLLILNSTGAVSYQYKLAGTADDKFYGVDSSGTTAYYVVGASKSITTLNQSYDAVLFRVTSAGVESWKKYYGSNANDDFFYAVKATPDGGCIAVGSTKSAGAGGADAWVAKFTSTGTLSWEKTYGGTGDDSAYSVTLTDDGGYIVAGSTASFGSGGDAWVLKLDSSGNPTKTVTGTMVLGGAITSYNNTNALDLATATGFSQTSMSQFGADDETLSSSSVTWTRNIQYP